MGNDKSKERNLTGREKEILEFALENQEEAEVEKNPPEKFGKYLIGIGAVAIAIAGLVSEEKPGLSSATDNVEWDKEVGSGESGQKKVGGILKDFSEKKNKKNYWALSLPENNTELEREKIKLLNHGRFNPDDLVNISGNNITADDIRQGNYTNDIKNSDKEECLNRTKDDFDLTSFYDIEKETCVFMYLQHDSNLCGPASMLTVLKNRGYDNLSLDKTAEDFGFETRKSRSGIQPGEIAGWIDSNTNLSAYVTRYDEIEELAQYKQKGDVIAEYTTLYNKLHFSPVYKIKKDKIILLDPANGREGVVYSRRFFEDENMWYPGYAVIIKEDSTE